MKQNARRAKHHNQKADEMMTIVSFHEREQKITRDSISLSTMKVVPLLWWIGIQVMSTASALSSTASQSNGKGIWSESAIQLAEEQSIKQREKLLSGEGVLLANSKDIRIIAERIDSTLGSEELRHQCNEKESEQDVIVSKIVHFQRHAQGYHNLLGDILRASGIKPSVDSMDPALNPWLRPEIVDSPLTEAGKDECRKQREQASQLHPQVVIVSPLLRAIQTAQISFEHVYDKPEIPWVSHEGCREELGVLVCNRRRPLSHIKHDFPNIEFLGEMTEEDTLWNPTHREADSAKSERIYNFLVNFLARRPESEMAVVGHSATLFHMCNAVLDCGNDATLSSWFLTSEIRSMRLTFLDNRLATS